EAGEVRVRIELPELAVDVRLDACEHAEGGAGLVEEGRIKLSKVPEEGPREAPQDLSARLAAGRGDLVDQVHELRKVVSAGGLVPAGRVAGGGPERAGPAHTPWPPGARRTHT